MTADATSAAATTGAITGVSIFDVDRTITRRPTYSHFLLFAARRIAPWRLLLLPVMVPLAAAYAAGLIKRRAMKQAMHRLALGSSLPAERAEAVAEQFAQMLVDRGLFPQATARMAAEAAEGRTVMLATAAPELYIRPLARKLGIAHVAATGAHWREGRLTHRISGSNCYGADKLDGVQALLVQAGVQRADAHVRFFSDHASDVHVGDWADEVFATNPSARMARLAGQRGWEILDWRGS
jgi:HAD superfamily hydrolase (TIGR01490 family)